MKAGKKLIYGVGINDADYNVNTIDEQGKRVRCPIYIQWKNMFMRCYSEAYQSRQPTYAGCTVDERWHSFMSFRSWLLDQDWEGNALDKDILFVGNKVYGPDTCVFVDQRTNSFFSGSKSKNSPRGVHLNGNKWEARTNYGTGQLVHCRLDSQSEALAIYEIERHNAAVELSKLQSDIRVSEILLTRFTPKS